MPQESNNQIIHKAGGIVIRTGGIPSIVLLYRNKQQDWTFPKGHIEPKETPEEAAVREIKEETGLTAEIFLELPPLEYPNDNGQIVIMHMYLMKCKNEKDLKKEHDGDRLEWIPITEVIKTLTHDNLKNYFAKVQPIIERFI